MNLAFALVQAGHKKVLVYMGGYPEWQDAGLPVERGTAEARG
jgi:3-mercaptopyruvate sulfurtransferase SseA